MNNSTAAAASRAVFDQLLVLILAISMDRFPTSTLDGIATPWEMTPTNYRLQHLTEIEFSDEPLRTRASRKFTSTTELFYTKRARALLNVAAALECQKLGDLADWGEFAHLLFDRTVNRPIDSKDQLIRRMRFGLGFCHLSCFGSHFERLKKARNTVSGELQQWLDCWKRDQNEPVSDFTVNWSGAQKRWDLQLDYHGRLFPAIAFQLTLVIGQADSLYSCSGCGIPYIRPRTRKRPKTGWANYCGQCSKGKVAQRLAAASYREKQAAIRMFSEGSSVPEIASRIERDVDLVQQWIHKGRKNASEKTRK